MNAALDFRGWDASQRERGSTVVMVAALGLTLVGGLLHWSDPATSETALNVLLVGVCLLLVFQAGVLYYGVRMTRGNMHAVGGPALPADDFGHAGTPTPSPEPEPEAPALDLLTLKCGECGTVFDVQDTGQRPLHHSCPGCGAQGMLRGELAPAPAPARAPAPAPAEGESTGEEATPPPPAPPEPPVLKRLKVRCGGCKSVLAIEDTGTRPLRHRCPTCGKLGEIR